MWTTDALCLYNICRFNAALHTNTDNKINKLVTVFALIICSLDNNWRGDKPGFPPLPVETSVIGDNNRRRFSLVPRHCTSAPRSHSNRGQHMAR